jgi:hypothetical protein
VITGLGPIGYFVFISGVTGVLAVLTLRALLTGKRPATASQFTG